MKPTDKNTRERTQHFTATIEQDHLGHAILRFPKNFRLPRRKKFVFKTVGQEAVLLPTPVRSRQLLRLNLARWKLRYIRVEHV